MTDRQTLVHLHSDQKAVPSKDVILLGEIAVQHATDEAALYIKKSNDTIAKFIDSAATVTLIDSNVDAVQKQIGTGFSENNTITDAITAITADTQAINGKLDGVGTTVTGDIATAKEEAIAAASAETKNKIAEITASTSVTAGYYITAITQTDGKVSIGQAALPAESDISATGDSYVTLSSNGHGVSASTKTHAVSSATADTEGLATAYGAKSYADSVKVTEVKYENNKIQLYNGNTAVGSGFDASSFIVDGMLSNAELVQADKDGNAGQFIHLTWNSDANDKEMYIDVATLVDTYTGDNTTIEVSDANVISVKANTFGSYDDTTANTYNINEITKAGGSLDTYSAATYTAAHNAITAATSGIITAVTVNGVDATVADKKATVTIAASNINVTEGQTVAQALTANANAITAETQNRETAIAGVIGNTAATATTIDGYTIADVKRSVAALSAGNVASATGDSLVSAEYKNNIVTVGATQDLSDAVDKANSAVQSIAVTANIAGTANQTVNATVTNGAATIDLSKISIDCGTYA